MPPNFFSKLVFRKLKKVENHCYNHNPNMNLFSLIMWCFLRIQNHSFWVKFKVYFNYLLLWSSSLFAEVIYTIFFQVSDDTITEFMEKVVTMIDDGKFSSDASLSRYIIFTVWFSWNLQALWKSCWYMYSAEYSVMDSYIKIFIDVLLIFNVHRRIFLGVGFLSKF